MKVTYTIRATEDQPAIVWGAETYLQGARWKVALTRNGLDYVEDIDSDEIEEMIKVRGNTREIKAAPRIARKIRGY